MPALNFGINLSYRIIQFKGTYCYSKLLLKMDNTYLLAVFASIVILSIKKNLTKLKAYPGYKDESKVGFEKPISFLYCNLKI